MTTLASGVVSHRMTPVQTAATYRPSGQIEVRTTHSHPIFEGFDFDPKHPTDIEILLAGGRSATGRLIILRDEPAFVPMNDIDGLESVCFENDKILGIYNVRLGERC